MLVSVLPFRRTRCKSHLRADLIIPLHEGLGPPAKPGPARASPSSRGAAHNVTVLHFPQYSAALLNREVLRDWGLLWRLLLSAESQRDDISTRRVWQKWWQIGHLIDSVSVWLGKHENGTSSLPSLVPSHIPCMVVFLTLQWKLLEENIS